MRVPPYHHDPRWQRFFAGIVIGAVLGWLIFIYIYGASQEQLVSDLKKYKKEVENYEERIHIITEDNEKLKEEKDKLKIQDFKITINNHDEYKLNSFMLYSIIDRITKDLNHLIFAKDVKNIAENKELLIKAIDNKSYKLDEKEYYFRVYSLLVIDTTVEIDLMIVKIE